MFFDILLWRWLWRFWSPYSCTQFFKMYAASVRPISSNWRENIYCIPKKCSSKPIFFWKHSMRIDLLLWNHKVISHFSNQKKKFKKYFGRV